MKYRMPLFGNSAKTAKIVPVNSDDSGSVKVNASVKPKPPSDTKYALDIRIAASAALNTAAKDNATWNGTDTKRDKYGNVITGGKTKRRRSRKRRIRRKRTRRSTH